MGKEKKQKVAFVMKIGGSVITYKNREKVVVRRKVIESLARDLFSYLELHPQDRCILVHGGGSAGHGIASQYGLMSGIRNDDRKWKGAMLAHLAVQRLNGIISDILVQNGLRIVSVRASSMVIQKNGKIVLSFLEAIRLVLRNRCIPLLHGDMVFDEDLNMSVCSGDNLAALLSDRFCASSLLFASDVDGIYDKDPHRCKDAKKIHAIALNDILKNKNIQLEGSHHVDVTGGLYGKIASLSGEYAFSETERVVIFNGLKRHALLDVLNKKSAGTTIRIK